MSIQYIYLGYGTTDENGECKLDHDANGDSISHSYTGTGAGKIDVVASLDAPSDIGSGSLVSETYEVLDAKWIYNGRTNSQASSWYNYQSYISMSYGDDGTSATTDGASTRYLYYNDSTVSSTKVGGYYSIPNNHCIEFDVTAITGSIVLVFIDDASTSNQRFIEITATGHYKCVMNGSTVVIYKDNAQQGSSYALTGNNVQFRFGFNATDESITFRDFIVYPI